MGILRSIPKMHWRNSGNLAALVTAAFAFTACSSGDASPPGNVMFDEAGNPMHDEPTGLLEVTDMSANGAPGFELVTFGNENHAAGETIRLSQFAGQPVVINFWFPSCPPCRIEMPDLEEASKRHKANGVQFIGVQVLGLDSAADGQEFIDDTGITYPVGPDTESKINLAYEVIGYPTSVFLSRDHQIVRSWTGTLNAEKLEELIQELLQ